MTDLAADRKTERRLSCIDMDHEFVLATGATIYRGSGVMTDSAGKLVHANASTGVKTVGIATQQVVSAAAGARLKVDQGIFAFANSGTSPLSIADRFAPCYWEDDNTVSKDSSKPFAGLVYDVSSTDGVWVIIDPNNDAALPLSKSEYVTLALTDLVGANAKRYGFVAPFAGKITKLRSVLLGAALTTGDCTLTGKINGSAITGGVVTITQSGSAIGDVDVATPSAANTVAAGDFVELLVGGTNAQTASFANVIVEISPS